MPLHNVTALLVAIALVFTPSPPFSVAAGPPQATLPATEPAPLPEPAPELVAIPSEDRTLYLDVPDSILQSLRRGHWERAAEELAAIPFDGVPGRRKGALAFLRGWALIHAGQAERAAPFLGRLDGAEGVPADHLDLVRGEVLQSVGEQLQALEVLARVPEWSPVWARAQVIRAEALRELERTSEAFEIYRSLADQPDPALGAPEALLALAHRAGAGSPQAYPLLRRVWEQYPKSQASRDGWPTLKAYGRPPTWQETARRAYVMMRKGWNDDARSAVANLSPPDGDRSDEACMLLYTKGRTAYRKNQLSVSVREFGDIGERCPDATEDWGARGLYLQGMAQFRRGQHRSADLNFSAIPELYPDSSYADDGWLHAGIALQEGGDLQAARGRWLRALDELPDGDTTPESTWRLAWSWYLDGDPERAIEVAERLGALSRHGDRRHVEAGRYWVARWQLYPNVKTPSAPTSDPQARDAAIEAWVTLCRELPHSYYSLLAFSRLVETAPERAAELTERPADHERAERPIPWRVRPEFANDPAVSAGVQLARLGLVDAARAAWGRAAVPAEQPDEVAWLFDLRIMAGDWLFAHDDMRGWIEHNPPGTLGEREPWILRVAYPDRYWDLVQEQAADYRYEPRLFHALVREESNFNRSIRSHAGAIGLSQLMPYTAAETAGWLKIPVGDLDDPSNNLKIGARYLDSVVGTAGGNPFLALAGYNAGPGRVRQWLGEWGNVPTDEYVERIPFRETRGYARRVTTTWQTYRFQFDDGPAFPDLSAYNHQARP